MQYTYEKLNYKFKVDEIVMNNNGYEYKVSKIVDSENILFERVKDSEKVIGYMPSMYNKIHRTTGKVDKVLEWASGKYIS